MYIVCAMLQVFWCVLMYITMCTAMHVTCIYSGMCVGQCVCVSGTCVQLHYFIAVIFLAACVQLRTADYSRTYFSSTCMCERFVGCCLR